MPTLESRFKAPTKTDTTVEFYLQSGQKLWAHLQKKIGRKISLPATIKLYTTLNNMYSKSTIRSHRAWLKAVTDRKFADGHITQLELEKCLYMLAPQNAPTPLEKSIKRTSGKKTKTIKLKHFEELTKTLSNSSKEADQFLSKLMRVMTLFFCRPSELKSLRIQGDDVVFRNAKNSNGRACGSERRFVKAAASNENKAFLAQFTLELHARIEQAGSWSVLAGQLNARLSNWCKKLKLKRVCLYTLRHVGISAAKGRFSNVEVAALAGHSSNKTAGVHYARRASAMQKLRDQMNFQPDTKNIALVREWPNAQRPAHAISRVTPATPTFG